MEKFNLNEGNDALKRVLLMMKYDNTKTLKENIGEIQEQTNCSNSITMESAIEKVKNIADLAKKMQSAFLRMGYAEERAQEIYQDLKDIYSHNISDSLDNTCRPGSEVFPEIFKKEHTNWFFGGGNLLTLLKDFKSGYYSNDSSTLRYLNASIGILEKGGVKPELNSPSLKVKPAVGTKPVGGKPVGKKPKSSYKFCKGTYTKGCKSNAIIQIQGCLGLKPDGFFGPKTQSALQAKGYNNGFTDADITKICNMSTTPPAKIDNTNKLTPDSDVIINNVDNTEF